ncbi:MAG: fasciclin domain-containing protein, partial [Bacteroidia bacterium]|nr:fasciclin domain-containing protein [Bacteroidia bacterium]
EFTSLIAALTRTANEGTAAQNLITVLNGDGPFTVFAPTNAAFQALLDSNSDWNSLNDVPLDALISVLTYHVVPARAYDKDLAGAVSATGEISTANGGNLTFDLTALTINSTTNITDINYNATNGVIHVIDSVLIP